MYKNIVVYFCKSLALEFYKLTFYYKSVRSFELFVYMYLFDAIIVIFFKYNPYSI